MKRSACTVRECSRPIRCKGLCGLHYQRWRIHGNPLQYTPREQRTKHGHARQGKISSEFYSWASMVNRVTNPRNYSYKYYGAKGIQVAARWLDFNTFLADMGPKPSPAHSLDRFPDRNGNYEPGNVRWASPEEQGNNKDRNVRLAFNGKVQTIAQWSRETGINYGTLRDRIRRHKWSPEKALTTPV